MAASPAPVVRGRIAYAYPGSRKGLAADVAAGTGADSFLLGQNHLHEFGYEAFIHESRVRAVSETSTISHRVRWAARDVVIPWEIRDADLVVSTLANLLPLSARLRGRPRAVVLDFALATVLDRRRGTGRRLLELSLRSAAAIVCLSDAQRTRLLERVSLDPDRVTTVLLGIDHEFLQPALAHPSGDNAIVLAVGKDLARDYRTLAASAREVDARFVIVTEQRNVKGIALPGNVEVTRGLTYSKLRDLYAEAACVVLPVRRPDYPYGTESGGFTALMEAMAMARPIVVSERPALLEYASPEATALFVPPEEPQALAAAISELVADPELGARLGIAARAKIEREHTMNGFAAGLAAVFDRVIQN